MRATLADYVRRAIAAFVVMSLAWPAGAIAEQSAEVRAQAQSQNERLEELVAQLDEQRSEVNDLDQQIDDLADQAIVLQGELIEERQNLAKMVNTSYRAGGSLSLVELMLSSNNVEEFVSSLYYAQKVTEWQVSCVDQVRDAKRELEENMSRIEQSRSDRSLVLADLDAKREDLQQTVDALLARAETLEEEERAAEQARLAEIARQAQLEEQRRAEEQAKAEAARQEQARLEAERKKAAQEEAERQQAEAEAARQEAERQEAERQQQEEERQRQEAERQAAEQQEAQTVAPTPVEEVDTTGASDWVTCIASAYTIADNDPPGSTATASGIPLDESVPTVAMPMSMDPARFYGSKIQIEYEGMTLVATVTDCGYMGGGSRGLDLTPAIFRAFGFTTADDWGLRQVRYRFL